jgi:hypothetical protein
MSRNVYRVIPIAGRPLGLLCAWAPIPNALWHRGHRMRPNTISEITMATGNVMENTHCGTHVTRCRASGANSAAKSKGTITRPRTRYCRLRYSRIVFTARDSTHCGAQRNDAPRVSSRPVVTTHDGQLSGHRLVTRQGRRIHVVAEAEFHATFKRDPEFASGVRRHAKFSRYDLLASKSLRELRFCQAVLKLVVARWRDGRSYLPEKHPGVKKKAQANPGIERQKYDIGPIVDGTTEEIFLYENTGASLIECCSHKPRFCIHTFCFRRFYR